MEKKKKRWVGYLLILTGIIVNVLFNKFDVQDQRFWLISGVSVVFWLVGGFGFLVKERKKRLHVLGWMGALVGLIGSPIVFLYAEASRVIAGYNKQNFWVFMVLEVMMVFLFFTCLSVVAKSVWHQRKAIKK